MCNLTKFSNASLAYGYKKKMCYARSRLPQGVPEIFLCSQDWTNARITWKQSPSGYGCHWKANALMAQISGSPTKRGLLATRSNTVRQH